MTMLRRVVNLSKVLQLRSFAGQDAALLASSTLLSGRAAVVQHDSSSTWTRCQSGSSCTAADSSDTHLQKKAAVNRLLYRSKQRGFLEMDLLVGLWAERNLPTMDAEQLTAMETLLDQENPDLFKWLTGQEEPPEAMKANPAFTDIKKDVEQRLAAHRDNAAMSRPGKDWVRGWDDWNRAPGPNAMAAPERKE